MTVPRPRDEAIPHLRLVDVPDEGARRIDDDLRLLVEACPDLMCVNGLDGRFHFVNPAFKTLLGYDPEQLIGKRTIDFVHPDDLARVAAVISEHPDDSSLDFRIRHANGEWVQVEMNRRLVKDAAGVTIGIVVVSRDVTERRKAEERFRLLAHHSPSGIYIVQDGRFVFVNPQFERYTGSSEEELLTMEPMQLVVADDRDEVRASAIQMLKGERSSGYEYRVVDKAGAIRWVMESVISIDYGGRRATLGNYTDVSERKAAEALQQEILADLARSNEELEQFAYVASHDLQEPLRMVASFTQLLQRRYQGQLGEDADEFIHYTIDGVTRMQTLINDLLTYSRVGTRGKPPEPTDCRAACDRALANLATAIEECGAKVTVGDLPTVQADPTQIEQLLQNLLGNAIKYRAEKVPEVSVTATAADGAWHFVVRDNGIGIDPEFKDRIFVIFQRLHGKDEYPGTGIGLAVCKKIVERHGGRIWVESRKGEGAQFHFTIRR